MADEPKKGKETKIYCSKFEKVLPVSSCLSCARIQDCLKEAFKNRTRFPPAPLKGEVGIEDEQGGKR